MVPTVKQQAANQRRSLKALKAKVLSMSAAWGDLDEYFLNRLMGLSDDIGTLEKEMTEFVADGENHVWE